MTDDERKILEAELYKLSPDAQELMKKFFDEFDGAKKLSPWEIFNYSTSLEDLPHEIWRDVVGYEGLYQVSNFGRGKSFYNKKIRILKDVLDGCGYAMWRLYKDGKPKMLKGHIVTARTFIPNLEDKPQINHINGDKLNNCVWNLEWSTGKENMQHSFRTGLEKPKRGCYSPNTNLTTEQIIEIRETCILGSKNFGAKALAKKFGTTDTAILNIVHGKTYTEIGGRREVKYSGLNLTCRARQSKTF